MKTLISSSTFLTILRNFGSMVVVCIALGSLCFKGKSHARQDKSLVKRTYQAKLMKDQEMNELLGLDDKKQYDEEGLAVTDQSSIMYGIYKLLIARQRLPTFVGTTESRLFAKGKKRLHGDLDIVNQARNTQRLKAMSQILMNDQQRMIMSLNKRTLLEDAVSSEPMTESPVNSEGETVAEKLKNNMQFTGVLNKGSIDKLETTRRAIVSITKRKFFDEEVEEYHWHKNLPFIVEAIERKIYEDPPTALLSSAQVADGSEQDPQQNKNQEASDGEYYDSEEEEGPPTNRQK